MGVKIMEMLCIVDNGSTYRIRKENIGCSIFGPGYFIEGDDITFDILKVFDKEGIETGYRTILKMYQVEPELLKKDLLDMATEFERQKVFLEMAEKIKKTFEGDS